MGETKPTIRAGNSMGTTLRSGQSNKVETIIVARSEITQRIVFMPTDPTQCPGERSKFISQEGHFPVRRIPDSNNFLVPHEGHDPTAPLRRFTR
jgi:hypothetical protein